MTRHELEQLEQVLLAKWDMKEKLRAFLKTVEITEEPKGNRTSQQNRALWKFFGLVADALIEKGVTMRTIFEQTKHFDIPPTKDNVHDLWIYFQKAMYKTDRTRDLKKTEQIDKVHEVMMKNLGEMFQIEYINFPSDPEKDKELLGGVRLSQHNLHSK